MFRVSHTVPRPRHDDAAAVTAGVTDSPKMAAQPGSRTASGKAYLVALSYPDLRLHLYYTA